MNLTIISILVTGLCFCGVVLKECTGFHKCLLTQNRLMHISSHDGTSAVALSKLITQTLVESILYGVIPLLRDQCVVAQCLPPSGRFVCVCVIALWGHSCTYSLCLQY